jgi:hypothetical protein
MGEVTPACGYNPLNIWRRGSRRCHQSCSGVRPTDDTVGFSIDRNRRILNWLLSSWRADRDHAIEQELDRPIFELLDGCALKSAQRLRPTPLAFCKDQLSMRGLLFFLVFVSALPLIFTSPFNGVLIW